MSEINAKTTKDRQDEIAAYVYDRCKVPSVFRSWDPQRMNYGGDKARHLIPMPEIERHFYDGSYDVSDMWVLLALNAFTYAPAECVLGYIRYLRAREVADATAEKRAPRGIPNYQNYKELWRDITDLTAKGLVARYNFYPEVPKPGREGQRESLFKVSGHAVSFYKKVLYETGIPYNPIDALCNPEDVFAFCLNAYAITPFFKSRCLKKVYFKEEIIIDKVKHRVKARMVFNKDGRNGEPFNDVNVLFEGITFAVNDIVVTANARYDLVAERVRELSGIYNQVKEKSPTYIIFCCEDALGMQKLSTILSENAPDLLERCLLTTGNVIFDSNSIYAPQNLKNCFMCYMRDANDNVRLTGADSLFFLNIDPVVAEHSSHNSE